MHAIKIAAEHGEKAFIIGRVIEGEGVTFTGTMTGVLPNDIEK